MLQQTQVKTVIPYFKKFTKKYKTLESLSRVNENQMLKLWEGLGYYRRARNLLASTKLLVKRYNYKLPNNLKEIKKLPGVGDYTANALMGFIHNYPTIAIDGNVKRILARYINKKESKIILINFINMVENKNYSFDFINEHEKRLLMTFSEIKKFPMRTKCATMSWSTFQDALNCDNYLK